MTTVREKLLEILDVDNDYDVHQAVTSLLNAGDIVPADEVEARIAEAVAGERHRISDWAWEIARQHDKEAKRLGLILNGRQRFAARKFRQFATAIRGDDHDG